MAGGAGLHKRGWHHNRGRSGSRYVNLAETLERTARARGGSPAITLGDQATSFGEVDRWSRRVAGFLGERGIRAGDRVGLVLPDAPEFAALYYGILRLGGVVVPISPLLTERGIRHRLADSGASAVVAWESARDAVALAARTLGIPAWLLESGGLADLLGDATPVDTVAPKGTDDTAVIAYTAGTTGEPLGAAITHGNLLRNCEVFVNDLVQLTSTDVVLCGLSLSHSFAQTAGLNASVRAGASLVLLARLEAEIARTAVQERGVTVLVAAPSLFTAMLRPVAHRVRDRSRLRVAVCFGAALPVEVLVGSEEAFDCVVLEGYGLAETSPLVSCNRMDNRRAGSIGVPVNGVELKVVDESAAEVEDGEPGELVVRGHNVMQGYWGRPAETAASLLQGWCRTGDLGIRDEDGFFHFVGRTAELITRGGHTVFPREVEQVLHEHQAVATAAVLGVPHPSLGEEIHALVTLRPDAHATPDELRAYVKERVAAHSYPREIDIVEAIPTTSTGEALKRAIRLEAKP